MADLANNDGMNWAQLADLMGDPSDHEQQAMFIDMWRDVKIELPIEWAKIDAVLDAAAMKRDLHRMRGYISTWGMDGVSAALLEIEKSPDPVSAWRERGRSLIAMQLACVAAIEARYCKLREAA